MILLFLAVGQVSHNKRMNLTSFAKTSLMLQKNILQSSFIQLEDIIQVDNLENIQQHILLPLPMNF